MNSETCRSAASRLRAIAGFLSVLVFFGGLMRGFAFANSANDSQLIALVLLVASAADGAAIGALIWFASDCLVAIADAMADVAEQPISVSDVTEIPPSPQPALRPSANQY